MQRIKKTIILALMGFLLFLALFLFKVKGEMADFEVNFEAGHRLWLGETLYRTEDQHWQFKYSPFSALVYLPLSFLPLPMAKGLWYFVVLISIGVLIFFSMKLALPGPKGIIRLAAIAFLILGKYFLRELQLGQINALITAILLGMTWLLVRDEDAPSASRERTAGLLWGLASALKPYAVIFFLYFLLKRKWGALVTGLIFLAASLCVPAFFYGIRGNITMIKEWGGSLSRSTPSLFTSQDNVSLLAFLAKWTGHQPISLLIFAAAATALAALMLWLILQGSKMRRPALLECALLLIFIPLLSPLGWDYTFLSSFLAIVLVIRHITIIPRLGKILLIVNFSVMALSLYDLLGRQLYAQLMAWSVPTVNFLIISGALFYLRLKKAA
jgi:hypothetical protein